MARDWLYWLSCDIYFSVLCCCVLTFNISYIFYRRHVTVLLIAAFLFLLSARILHQKAQIGGNVLVFTKVLCTFLGLFQVCVCVCAS